MIELTVELGKRSYPIFIGAGLLSGQGVRLNDYLRSSQVMVVSNETVAPLYLEDTLAHFDGCQVDSVILPDGEQHKNLEVLDSIFSRLLEARHSRGTTLVALGGGVVGDMTGFAAACYQRGVDLIQVPTTLLSQVDSSVGGKTGVNHPLGKNMIGAFHQPNCVLIDTATLDTLPDREFSAGVAEVIKYGLIADLPFFEWLEKNIVGLMAKEPELLAEAIRRSCQNKADVVARDETEQGVRAILNLGHTFGHAIEASRGYGQWLHGEAVAAGMVMAASFSAKLGLVDRELVGRIETLLQQASLPIAPPPEMTVGQFRQYMSVDKKVQDGQIRLVLLEALGKARVSADFPAALLDETIEESLGN